MSSGENALISVYNKEGIVPFVEGLHQLDWSLYASGGTAREITEAGLPVHDVAELVGGEAILGHRVVTLSREVHAGLLADTQNDAHIEELERLGIPLLSLVCVDMYPLADAISQGKTEQEVTDMTDIGGPTMLHSAAKGRRIVLSKPAQRTPVLEWLKEGRPDEENVLRVLAATAETVVGQYIESSGRYLSHLVRNSRAESSYDTHLRWLAGLIDVDG